MNRKERPSVDKCRCRKQSFVYFSVHKSIVQLQKLQRGIRIELHDEE